MAQVFAHIASLETGTCIPVKFTSKCLEDKYLSLVSVLDTLAETKPREYHNVTHGLFIKVAYVSFPCISGLEMLY